MKTLTATAQDIESPYAWTRLVLSLVLMTIGGCGMYTVIVVLPQIQADFAVARGDASLPYTVTLIGFGCGGVLMGRLSDRYGVLVPMLLGTVFLGAGFILAGVAGNLWQFCLAQGVLIGFLGSSASFGPLVADTSQWFSRRRGIAIAICMSGNYLAGAVWSPVTQHFVESAGWRQTYIGIGVFCLCTMLPLSWFILRRRPPLHMPPVAVPEALSAGMSANAARAGSARPLGFSPAVLQGLLCVASVACCVAMAMPQVHLVAYCGDLGYGAARGAEMLALMMAAGILSRLLSGWIADRIGGLWTLLLGSVLQGVALVAYLFTTGVTSLYVVSAMFGLFQGGITLSYALIVREYFTPGEAGARVGTTLMAALSGMALGGWLSGVLFDLTGSYRAAFLNGIAWNLLNVGIVLLLLYRAHGGRRLAGVAAA